MGLKPCVCSKDFFRGSKTVAFATGETVKNNICLTINKLRIVIKSKTQQNRNSRRKRAAFKRQNFWAPSRVIPLFNRNFRRFDRMASAWYRAYYLSFKYSIKPIIPEG